MDADATFETPPRRVLGDFELLRPLGQGASGTVWEGRQRSLDRIVAIKLLHGFDSQNEERRARFTDEAAALARVAHPGIVPILDRGAASGDFKTDVDPYLFYWSVFALATGAFTQSWSMSESSGVDFSSDAGIAMWREHVTALVLGGMRPDALPE